jgi:TolB-like protein/Tfp pilus assembly protein PilF
MNWRNFFGELQRRNVYRLAVTYAVVSWLLIQIAAQVFPIFDIPNWAVRVVILLLLLGFPVALILAWAFEITPEGIKRTEDVTPHESIRHNTGRKLLAFGAIAAAIALGMLLIQLARRTSTSASQDSPRGVAAPGMPALAIPEKSIAVLPFRNLSAQEENVFFTEGIQDEVLANLAKVADLKVISRSSVMVYKSGNPRNMREIGRQLGVAYLLEGSVQRSTNRVRVMAQLIDARTDAQLWGEQYDRELADAFAIQSEIAQAIADHLQAKLSPTEKAAIQRTTRDVEAFDLYLRAKELLKTFHDTPNWKETLLKAVRLLDEATSRDPDFALAYCWLTTAHDGLYWYSLDRTPARLAQAQATAQKALALAPDLGEAHLAQALVYYHGNRDYARALEELALARRTLPNSAEVYSLGGAIARRQGHWEDAVKNLEKAVDLDPRNPKILNSLSDVYDLLRRYDDELMVFDRAVAANPSTRDYCQVVRAQVELERGETKAARLLLSSLPGGYDPDGATTWTRIHLALYENDPESAAKILAAWKKEELVGGTGRLLPASFFEALIARARGDSAKASEAFAVARAKVEAQVGDKREDALLLTTLGLINAGLSRKDDALRDGHRAVELRPIEEDAVDGATVISSLAMIYAWVGDIDSAIERLAFLAKKPGGPHYGQLKYDPAWDALRGDSRFTEIVNQLQPRPKGKR